MKITATITAISMAVAGVTVAADHPSRELIVGGTKNPEGTKQFVCGLRCTPDGENHCTGALIDHKYVLTTAYCGALHKDQPLYVSCGSNKISGQGEGERIKVVSVQNHTNHDVKTGNFDFALLKLEKSSNITAIKLPKPDGSDLVGGLLASVLGWGYNSVNGSLNQELQVVRVPVWSKEGCMNRFSDLNKGLFCAGGVRNKDTCKGDEGALLINSSKEGDAQDILLGLSTGSDFCGQYLLEPSFYANVALAVDWIKLIICEGGQQCQ